MRLKYEPASEPLHISVTALKGPRQVISDIFKCNVSRLKEFHGSKKYTVQQELHFWPVSFPGVETPTPLAGCSTPSIAPQTTSQCPNGSTVSFRAKTLSLTHNRSLCLSLSHTHTHPLSLSLSHTHTHTLSLSLSLSFSRTLRRRRRPNVRMAPRSPPTLLPLMK